MSGSDDRGFWSHKRLVVTFRLGTGDFGEAGFDTTTLPDDLRVSASVSKVGSPGFGVMQLRIWGMTLKMMNKLSTLGMRSTDLRRNEVMLQAGDDTTSTLSTVFVGTIVNAWADFSGMPDVVFTVMGQAGALDLIKPVAPTSYKGVVDVASAMQALASKMGRTFENTGVTAKLVDQYLPGTAADQARRLAKAADISLSFDDNKLAIWPKGGARGSQVPLVNEHTGMREFPTFTALGIAVTTMYNPSIIFGGAVQVKSRLETATGRWILYDLGHELDANVPKGNWFTRFEAAAPGFGPAGAAGPA